MQTSYKYYKNILLNEKELRQLKQSQQNDIPSS